MILREEEHQDTNEKHSLYLRFPKKLNADRILAESEVKSLNSKIISVRIPRQRSANFCLVDFASKEDKEKACKKLKTVEVNGRALVVKEAVRNDKVRVHKKIEKTNVKRQVNQALGKLVGDIKNSLAKKYTQRNVTNGVMIMHLKADTSQGDIRQVFPQAIDIKMNVKADRKNSLALVWLPTPNDAREAAQNTVQINGEEYEVMLENDGKPRKRKRRNKANCSSDGGADAEETDDGDESDEVNESDDGSESSEVNESNDVEESD